MSTREIEVLPDSIIFMMAAFFFQSPLQIEVGIFNIS